MSFEHIGKFLSPISRFFGSQPGPVESPEVSDASLKRKRSEECQPRTNSADNPICIEDEADAEEDEIIADSEEERDEMRLRGAYGVYTSSHSRNTRQRTGSLSHSDDRQNARGIRPSFPPASLQFQPNTFSVEKPPSGGQGSNSKGLGMGTWDDQRRELEGTIGSLKDEICSLRKDLSTKHQIKLNLQDRCGRLERDLVQANDLREQAHGKIGQLERQCADTETRLEKAKNLLHARTEELTIAQAFMTTADKFSVADVTRLVEQLNDDIYQISAVLSDLLQDKRPGQPSDSPDLAEARKKVVERYGEDIVAKLIADIAQDDTILFECLVQEFCTAHCQHFIQAICPMNTAVNKALRAVWEQLVLSQETSIAKNWLAMTSSQMKVETVDAARLVHMLSHLMTLCGWRSESPSSSALPEPVLERLADVLRKALTIREMVNEGILSIEIDIFRCGKRWPYDTRIMQDAYAIGKSPPAGSPPDIAICTTGLGVQCIKRVLSGSNPAKKVKTADVTLKCKVLLASTLTTPPPPDAP